MYESRSCFRSGRPRVAFAAVCAEAFIAVPLIKDGRLVACLCATDGLPRDWTQDEVELVSHTGERGREVRRWSAPKRRPRCGEAKRKYRTLF